MPILELCAGYGGLGMAVEQLTGDRVAFVAEVDPAASKILALRYPDAPNIGDITTYDWNRLTGKADIVTAGSPCQDISNAGKREGITGERSGIWKSVAEAVGVLRPRLVFLENVAAIRVRGLDVVAEDLAEVGYDFRWTTLRASDVGAAHQRNRWFGVAYPARAQDSHSQSRLIRGSSAPGEAQEGGHGPTLDDEACFLLPYSDRIGRDGGAGNEPEPEGRDEPPHAGHSPAEWWGDFLPAIRRWEAVTEAPAPEPTEVGPRGGRRLAAPFAEWLMGIPQGWVTEVPGLNRSGQLKAIGNGVVPLQAYEAYRWLMEEN